MYIILFFFLKGQHIEFVFDITFSVECSLETIYGLFSFALKPACVMHSALKKFIVIFIRHYICLIFILLFNFRFRCNGIYQKIGPFYWIDNGKLAATHI